MLLATIFNPVFFFQISTRGVINFNIFDEVGSMKTGGRNVVMDKVYIHY